MMPTSKGHAAIHILFRLLDEWRELTISESNAIEAEDWRYLTELQARKSSLQQSIQETEERVFHGDSLTEAQKQTERQHLRQKAADLASLEQKNQETLTRRISETDAELKASNRTMSSLRGVQKAYGRSGRSFWQAYS